MQTSVLKYFQKLPVIWLTFYGKQNNVNLDALKQDSYYSLWLDYNILLSSMCVLETIFVFSDHIMWFSLPFFRYELLSLKVEWWNKISYPTLDPECTKSYSISYLNISIISIYLYIHSLCKGILPHKDLHPPTEISSERQDISERKKHTILYKPSASWLMQFIMMNLGTGAKKIGGRNL